MFENLRQHRKKVGAPPGTVQYVGDRANGAEQAVRITLIQYSDREVSRSEPEHMRDCACFREAGHVTWVNIDGVHHTGVVTEAGEVFGLHPLVLEDIVHTDQRPKIEDMDAYLFLVCKMLRYDEEEGRVLDEQVSFVLGPHYVLSFQEEERGDVFDGIRERIASGKGKIRKMGADYLLYSLLDAVVDNYFTVLEKVGDAIEDIEEGLLEAPSKGLLEELHSLRRETLFLRKFVWPLREIVSLLEKQDTALVSDQLRVYLRDLYDHVIRVMDTIETFRDVLSGLADLYLSKISLKLNEVMKLLTIISTFFIPLTFIAGVYGMNFEHMPELHWRYGYALALGLMACISLGMRLYFKRRGWL